jgi:DoxX-like family
MTIFLWILQGILAVVFAGSGIAKSTMSRERLIATGQTGVALFPMPVVRLTALAEIAGAVGITLPWATGVLPVLTPVAALGFCAVMLGAMSSHWRLREPRNVAVNAVLLAMALTVALGRFAGL